jgi:hypothetical protein
MEKAMISVGIDVSGLKKILDGKNLKCSDIYIMTADTQGNYFISEKEDKRHDKG